ncbi:hypothetical protein DSL64_18635 [Dyadobacter luteus]|uniref:Polysaccharide biosynthesis protein CapD-like domain-containing protein n=1 Tax=Dyadobacter luteus TaxID=2259619 RepID=A0A3D8Y869_9BACT|nr:polysaccharide biosynthesis protein [Dyadobacter luteus]REA59338.1 hypothetical protein DSL64_18635 [Dyadobacter luteus]
MEQLLLRESITLDSSNIENYIHGKRIMITGAAGSIGSELLKQALQYQPAHIVAVDHSESGIAGLKLHFPLSTLSTPVADINDPDHMKRLFSEYKPEIVFHAAACKHVNLLETQLIPAIKNNIFATHVLATLAIEFGVSKFVFISTDKAVNPTSIMGLSKRICELYLQSLKTNTQFIITRFGNVLGSSGSVYPIFLDRIKQNKPLEITHPEVTRYFMTIQESVLLVLEAAAIGKSGQIMIFEMGNPLSIVELANRMITKYQKPGQHIDIVFTGLRPGEKLHEELQYLHEKTVRLYQGKIRIIESEANSQSTIEAGIKKLRKLIKTATIPELNLALKSIL